jgi:formiminoglutamase
MKLLKVSWNSGALEKKEGIEEAPEAIISNLGNFYLKESGILPFFEVADVQIDNSDIGGSIDALGRAVANTDSPAIIIGGDHSLTYASFKAFSKKYRNPGLVVFDAHLDCENDFSPPTHEDFLRVLINEGHVKKENVVCIGTRNFHSNELEFWKKSKLKVFDMKEMTRDGIPEVADAIMAVAKEFDALYVSVDIDVLDPAFAPGTGYREPGGISTRDLIYFVQRLKNLKNIKMWDVVEVNPKKDIEGMTSLAAAKLIVEMS